MTGRFVAQYGASYGAFCGALRTASEAFAPKGAYGPTLWRTLHFLKPVMAQFMAQI